MEQDNVTQEQSQQAPRPRAKKKKNPLRWFVYLIIILGVVFVTFSIKSSFTNDESVWSHLLDVTDRYIHPTLSFSDSIAALTADAGSTLTGIEEDRVNILLMGIGGRGHDGGNLTDTIIIASYKPSTNEASMMSIPRDLIVPIPGYGWRKINHLYALAEYNDPGTGGDYAKQIISQIFGVQIPYYVRVDFNGFEEIIDLVGGVDVEVPNTLSDYQYPIPGREEYPEDQRYEHLYIEAGQQHFDGSTALKYVRSRHALGEEGSDFARAARQQLVIDALADKMLSFSTLLQPGKIKKIINNVQENLDTNLSLDEMVSFAKLAKEYKSVEDRPDVINVVLDNDIEGPLQAANYNGAFVLEPKVEGFEELKFIAQNIFNQELEYIRPASDTGLPRVTLENPIEASETATIEIQNGTFVNGLARATQEKIEDLGYEVVAIGNSQKQDFTETIIYDFSSGAYPKTLDFLAGNYTDNISSSIPLGVSSQADILIILGLDSAY